MSNHREQDRPDGLVASRGGLGLAALAHAIPSPAFQDNSAVSQVNTSRNASLRFLSKNWRG